MNPTPLMPGARKDLIVGNGLLGVTLRYPYEVRAETEYFKDIPDEKIPKEMLDLATHIIDTKRGDFDPAEFDDRYEDALAALVKAKLAGKPLPKPKPTRTTKPSDLMEALRRSAGGKRKAN